MMEQEFESALDAQTPIIENMVVGVPPAFVGLTKQLDKIVEQPLLGPRNDFPRGSLFILSWPTKHMLMRIQLHSHSLGKMSLGIDARKLLPIEGTRHNFPKTLWVPSKAQ
jgi:hypothetical protein